jgi:hypothetical protein
VDVGVGAALLTVGAAGVLALLIAAGTATVSPPLWGELWFLAAVSFFGLLTAVGLYVLSAVYFRLPLPQTRAARETRADLELGEITVSSDGDGFSVVHAPTGCGRLDIDNATMNFRVPDFSKVHPCMADGKPLLLPGRMEHTSESLYPDNRCGSNYWAQQRMHFSAFVALPMYFRLDYGDHAEPFPIHLRITASALHGAVEAKATITPAVATQPRGTSDQPQGEKSALPEPSDPREAEPAQSHPPGEGGAPTHV